MKLHPVTLLELARGAVRPEDVNAGVVISEAPGAMKNGTRVEKVTFEPGDYHPIGATAVVLGSIGPLDGEYGYFVRWDDEELPPVFVRGSKLRAIRVA